MPGEVPDDASIPLSLSEQKCLRPIELYRPVDEVGWTGFLVQLRRDVAYVMEATEATHEVDRLGKRSASSRQPQKEFNNSPGDRTVPSTPWMPLQQHIVSYMSSQILEKDARHEAPSALAPSDERPGASRCSTPSALPHPGSHRRLRRSSHYRSARHADGSRSDAGP